MNPILEGWKCPSCFLIHAPFVASCSCLLDRVHDSNLHMTAFEALAKQEVEKAFTRTDAAILRREAKHG